MRDSAAPLALVNEGLGNGSYLVDLGDHRADQPVSTAHARTHAGAEQR